MIGASVPPARRVPAYFAPSRNEGIEMARRHYMLSHGGRPKGIDDDAELLVARLAGRNVLVGGVDGREQFLSMSSPAP